MSTSFTTKNPLYLKERDLSGNTQCDIKASRSDKLPALIWKVPACQRTKGEKFIKMDSFKQQKITIASALLPVYFTRKKLTT